MKTVLLDRWSGHDQFGKTWETIRVLFNDDDTFVEALDEAGEDACLTEAEQVQARMQAITREVDNG